MAPTRGLGWGRVAEAREIASAQEPLFVHAGLRVQGHAAAAKRHEPFFSHPDCHRRPRDPTGSAPVGGSRAVPPVGNCTLP